MIQAYFDAKPDTHDIALLETRLNAKAVVEQLPDEDWLTLSQNSIAPVRAGRFHVHTSTNKGIVPAGAHSFLIEAGQAFGTGGHETTSGCLAMLDRLQRSGPSFPPYCRHWHWHWFAGVCHPAFVAKGDGYGFGY